MVNLPANDPLGRRRPNPIKYDKRGVRFSVPKNEEWLTTVEIAKALSRFQDTYQETIYRWCVKWFGPLPSDGPTRSGVGGGYRIPPPYLLVARAWQMTQDEQVREAAKVALVESPKDWVVVVADQGSTCYSEGEVIDRITSILSGDRTVNRITILHVGGLLRE